MVALSACAASTTASDSTTRASAPGFLPVTPTFAAPPASTFNFVAPAGITVKEVASVSDLLPISQSRHHDDGQASVAAPPAGAGASKDSAGEASASGTVTVGDGWESVEVLNGSSMGRQLDKILGAGASIALPGGKTGHVVSTPLVNAVMSDDGRVAVGAVNTATLAAALGSPSKA